MWLRISKSDGTTGDDRSDLAATLPTVPDSPRQRKLRERRERADALRGQPPAAAEALRKAMRWQREIEETGVRRADIAQRERITRARVTQIMSLLDLPANVRAEILAAEQGTRGWTIRGALRRVGT